MRCAWERLSGGWVVVRASGGNFVDPSAVIRVPGLTSAGTFGARVGSFRRTESDPLGQRSVGGVPGPSGRMCDKNTPADLTGTAGRAGASSGR